MPRMTRTKNLPVTANQWGEYQTVFSKRLIQEDYEDGGFRRRKWSLLHKALIRSGYTKLMAWQQSHKRYPPAGKQNRDGPVQWGALGCPTTRVTDCVLASDQDFEGNTIGGPGYDPVTGLTDPERAKLEIEQAELEAQGLSGVLDNTRDGLPPKKRISLSRQDAFTQEEDIQRLLAAAKGRTASDSEAIQWAASNALLLWKDIEDGDVPSSEAVGILAFAKDSKTSSEFWKRRIPQRQLIESKNGMMDSGNSIESTMNNFVESVERMGGVLV